MKLGEVDRLIERSTAWALPPADQLAQAIVAAVRAASGLRAAVGRLSRVKWTKEPDYAEAAFNGLLLGCLHGHVQVWMDGEGVTEFQQQAWVDLPPKEAIEYFQKRTPILTPRAFKALGDAAKVKAWTIAGHHNAFTRAAVKESLLQAIVDGVSKSAWLAEAEDLFQRLGVVSKGAHHLETVFDTNVIGAYNSGRWRQQNTPVMIQLRPLLRYVTLGDKRVRPSHAAMAGFTARRNHPAWGKWYPPNGFRCRCTVEAIRDDGSAVNNRKRAPGKPDKGFEGTPADFWGKPLPPPRQRAGRTKRRTAKEAREARQRQRVAPQ